MPKFDVLYQEITQHLKNDYVEIDKNKEKIQHGYFLNAIGQAYKDNKLDALLFFRFINQYLVILQDSNLKFHLLDYPDYVAGTRGFSTRRIQEGLCITEASDEKALQKGDLITLINQKSPQWHQDHLPHNLFGSDDKERQNFDGFLKMADTIHVVRGQDEFDLNLKTYPNVTKQHQNTSQILSNKTYLNIEVLDDTLFPLLEQATDHIILDLRHCTSGNTSTIFPLLSYFIDLSQAQKMILEMGSIQTLYTEANCRAKMIELEHLKKEADEETKAILETIIQDFKVNLGQGNVSENIFEEEMLSWTYPKKKEWKQIILLLDITTQDEAEIFANMLMNCTQVTTIGRVTSGKYRTFNPVSIVFDSTFLFQFPMSKFTSPKALPVPPERLIPFTEQECHEDIILQLALSQ